MGIQVGYLLILKDIPASFLRFKVTFFISTGKGTLGARAGDWGTSLPCDRVLVLGPYLALFPFEIGFARALFGFVFLHFPFVFNNLMALFLHFKVSKGQVASSLLTVPGTQVVLGWQDRVKMFSTTQKTSHLAPISKAEVGLTTALAPKGEGTGKKLVVHRQGGSA